MSRECLNIDRHDLEARETARNERLFWDFVWESTGNYGSSEQCLRPARCDAMRCRAVNRRDICSCSIPFDDQLRDLIQYNEARERNRTAEAVTCYTAGRPAGWLSFG